MAHAWTMRKPESILELMSMYTKNEKNYEKSAIIDWLTECWYKVFNFPLEMLEIAGKVSKMLPRTSKKNYFSLSAFDYSFLLFGGPTNIT